MNWQTKFMWLIIPLKIQNLGQTSKNSKIGLKKLKLLKKKKEKLKDHLSMRQRKNIKIQTMKQAAVKNKQ